MEYASKATGGTALGLGIAGTAGWLLNGGLGNLFGGLGANGVVAPAVAGLAAGMASQKCGDDANVSRYELNQTQTIAQKDMEIAYWRGQDETNRKITDAFTKLENRILGLAGEVRANKEEQNGINLQQAAAPEPHEARCSEQLRLSRLGRSDRQTGGCDRLIHRRAGEVTFPPLPDL